MKFNLLLSLVFTLEIISIVILVYSISCLYLPFIINIFTAKFNQANFQPMRVSFIVNPGSSIIVNKIHEFQKTKSFKAIEKYSNQSKKKLKSYSKSTFQNKLNKMLLICILLLLFLIFTKISLVIKIFKNLINKFPSKPFFTKFYQYNYVVYTFSILIINMKIFDLFNNLTANDCFGFKDNSLLSFTYMRKLTNYSSSETFLGNVENLIYSSKHLANQYPNPFLFFNENEFLQEDRISYIPILTFFCGIIWISATLGVYESERETNQLNIFFKILSFLMWGYSLAISCTIYVDYVQLYFRIVFYSFYNIFSIDVFINLIAMLILVITHVIIFIITLRNYKKEKYNRNINTKAIDGEKKIFIDQTNSFCNKDDQDTINQVS